MYAIRHALAAFCLVAVGAPALRADDNALVLKLDTETRMASAFANTDAWVLLLTGPRLAAPIKFGGVEIWVQPISAIPFGPMQAHEAKSFEVPQAVVGMTMQLLGVETEKLTFVASDPVLVEFPDLVTRTFAAELAPIMGGYTLHVSMTVPTSAYELLLDSCECVDFVTRAYFRLVAPAAGEPVLPVLTKEEMTLKLAGDIGVEVEVHLMRDQRNGSGLPYYELMKKMNVHPGTR